MSEVEAILLESGPCLSSDVARKLTAHGLSADAARQRVARAGPKALRLKGLVFPRNARFLYHKHDEGKERYWQALLRDISHASPAYSAAVAALQAHGGIVPLRHFPIICGSPIRQVGQISADTALQRLEAVQLVERGTFDGVGEVVRLQAGGLLGTPNLKQFRARLNVEKILLLALRDWARRLGVASYDKIRIRDDEGELPTFGNFNWDLCGPSYMVPIARRSKEGVKPGFFVGDVIAGTQVSERAIAAFVRKYTLSTYLPNLSPFLPVLIADGFSPEAFNLGRAHGLMLATPKNLFGADIAIGLSSLLETLTKAAAVAVQKPQVIGELFDRLGAIDGADRNLRGSLFELVVGHVTQGRSGGSIDINHLVRTAEFRAEVDVRRVLASDVWLYECKGYQPDHLVGIDEIERWLKHTVPGLYKATKDEPRFNTFGIHFEFWTSGRFSEAAIVMLEAARDRTRRYTIGWKDGPEVRAELARLPSSGMATMFDQHFLKHPITKFDRLHDGTGTFAAMGTEEPHPLSSGSPPMPTPPPKRQTDWGEQDALMAYERRSLPALAPKDV